MPVILVAVEILQNERVGLEVALESVISKAPGGTLVKVVERWIMKEIN